MEPSGLAVCGLAQAGAADFACSSPEVQPPLLGEKLARLSGGQRHQYPVPVLYFLLLVTYITVLFPTTTSMLHVTILMTASQRPLDFMEWHHGRSYRMYYVGPIDCF